MLPSFLAFDTETATYNGEICAMAVLPTVAAHLGVELQHHDALSDARACGFVAAAALAAWGHWSPRRL